MSPQIYLSLPYEAYKGLERQCLSFKEQETSHTTTAGFYHKAFRLDLGDLLIEFQGPLVAGAGLPPQETREATLARVNNFLVSATLEELNVLQRAVAHNPNMRWAH